MSFGGFGWLIVLRINVTLAVFQPYRDLEAGDNQSLKFKLRNLESNPGPLAPQAKSLTTRPPPLTSFGRYQYNVVLYPPPPPTGCVTPVYSPAASFYLHCPPPKSVRPCSRNNSASTTAKTSGLPRPKRSA